VVFVLSSVVQALDRLDAVFYGALVGVILGAAAVPLGLFSMRASRPDDEPLSRPHDPAGRSTLPARSGW
jgi:hypothetical protein